MSIKAYAVLLELLVMGISIIQCRPQEVGDSFRWKSTPNSDFLKMYLKLVFLVSIGIVSNSKMARGHISIQPKIGLAKNDPFDEISLNL